MDEKNKIIEFNNNVWNHSEDKFQQDFDERRNLRQEEYVFLNEINLMISNHESDEDILNFLRENFVSRNFETLELLLQIIGMTRNKIVSDLKGIVGARKAEYKLSNHKSIFRFGFYLSKYTNFFHIICSNYDLSITCFLTEFGKSN